MSDIQTWDPSAINNQQPAPDGWPENTMTVSQVNDAGREMMAALARWYLDTNGSLVSTGTGAAYTVTPTRTISAYFDGLVVAFEAHVTNTGAATLALTGLTAKDIRLPDNTALIAGDLQAGGKALVIFDASTDRWQLISGPMTRPASLGATGLQTFAGLVAFDAGINVGANLMLATGGFFDLTEISLPANPAANVARLFAADDGAGNSNLVYLNSAGLGIFLRGATQAEMEAASLNVVFSTPGRQHFHPGHPKAWGRVTETGTLVSGGYNVASAVRNSTGTYTVTLDNAMANTSYAVVATSITAGTGVVAVVSITSSAVFVVRTGSGTGTPLDRDFAFVVFGDMA